VRRPHAIDGFQTMTASTLRDQLSQRIADQLAVADRLLSSARDDERTQIRLAVHDLNEASGLLNQQPTGPAQSLLQIVDLLVETAEWRLTMVDKSMKES
jgi:hypothetical protein